MQGHYSTPEFVPYILLHVPREASSLLHSTVRGSQTEEREGGELRASVPSCTQATSSRPEAASWPREPVLVTQEVGSAEMLLLSRVRVFALNHFVMSISASA